MLCRVNEATALSIARTGRGLYLKALEKLQLYALTAFKNGEDI